MNKEDRTDFYGQELTYDLLKNPRDNNKLFEQVVKNSQFQFRVPKSAFVDEVNPWGVSYQTVKKEFRLAYTKGNVDKDGFITPFVI